MHLDGCTFEAGSRFSIDVNLFDPAAQPAFMQSFSQLATDGLGPDRKRVELLHVVGDPIKLNLDQTPAPIYHLKVRFLTPTELKGGTVPTFSLLSARVRDRISTLSFLYGDGPLLLDFRAVTNAALKVETYRCTLKEVQTYRTSTRTGQTHALAGFVGEAEYTGNLGEFVSLFSAACYTGVGRQTVWGKGQIQVDY